MLEALLNHFRSYGMNDLEFMIVNSKLTHAHDKLHELQKRVSFPVYQETEQEEVWNVLEGGKDDMYIYDRCGRLTYFIPFPLSILNESPLLSNAILATYFQSPCGSTCDQKPVDVDEIVKNMVNGFDSSNNTEEEEDVYEVTEQYTANNETQSETLFPNNLIDVIDPENESYLSNSTDINNVTDYDYPLNNDTYDNIHNETSHLNNNDTSVDKAKVFFNNIYRLFFNAGNINEAGVNNNVTFSETQDNVTSSNATDNKDLGHQSKNTHHSHEHHHKHKHSHRNKKKSDRCVEADYEVCKSWSKKRLLHAQKCCSETESDIHSDHEVSCHNYGKKRCKKIQSILKCCIKTEYLEPTTAEPIETTVQPAEVIDVVCCKNTDEGKFCRVSSTGDCKEDEEQNSSQTK